MSLIDFGTRRIVLSEGRRRHGDHVEIIAIAHGRRRPGYWPGAPRMSQRRFLFQMSPMLVTERALGACEAWCPWAGRITNHDAFGVLRERHRPGLHALPSSRRERDFAGIGYMCSAERGIAATLSAATHRRKRVDRGVRSHKIQRVWLF